LSTVDEPAVARGWLPPAVKPAPEYAHDGFHPRYGPPLGRHRRRLDVEITQRVAAAGLTLEETAAIAADSLVRRGIEKALDNLDQVVQAVRDADFGTEHHPNPGALRQQPSPLPGSRDELARYWLDQGESALDLALAALTRVAELGRSPHSDLGILRDKLAILATLMNGR
jgi:hypothetical protein